MEKRESQFVGREHSKKEISKAVKAMQEWKREASSRIESEKEKTALDLKIIGIAQELLANELYIGGIERPVLTTEKIHIFDGDSYRRCFNRSDAGFFQSTKGAIHINLEKADTRARYLATLLHELVHAASAQKFYMDKERNIYDARFGYRLRSMWKKDRMQNAFHGLNEFMAETVVYMTLLRNADKLQKELGISLEDISGPLYSYMKYGRTINSIVDKIASYKGESSGKILGSLSRGLFENTILRLKDVEKVFGKGSLRILSSLGSFKDEEKDEQNRKFVEEFFTTNDGQRRDELRKDILKAIESHRIYS